MVLPLGRDPLGTYIETRPNSGKGYDAIPGKRIQINPKELRKLPDGEDADFELPGKFPSEAF